MTMDAMQQSRYYMMLKEQTMNLKKKHCAELPGFRGDGWYHPELFPQSSSSSHSDRALPTSKKSSSTLIELHPHSKLLPHRKTVIPVFNPLTLKTQLLNKSNAAVKILPLFAHVMTSDLGQLHVFPIFA